MDRPLELFRLAPSHVYLAAHWTPQGWQLTCSSSSGGPRGYDLTRTLYGPLTSSELLDVACGELSTILGH